MKRVLKDLKPERVFYYFEEICNIPHGSGNTKAISDYCMQFARERGLECYQDEWNNVIIKKEASKGYENVATIILQGHLDMVCEKTAQSEHDFSKDPLSLAVDNDYVYANKTTLGGDDGIAIAYALAILEDDSIAHPPLEIIMTTEEETGMDGAQNLDCSQLLGKYMINIDSEEEGSVLVSCAGGITVHSTLPITYKKASGIQYTFSVGGLKGGHSGTDIDKQRANAIVLLGRFIALLEKKNVSFSIIRIDGGGKDNAIPREGSFCLLIQKNSEEKLRESLYQFEQIIKAEYQISDPLISFSLKKGEEKREIDVFSDDCKQTVLTFLLNAFHGVFTMSLDTPGIVESSSNFGIIQTTKECINFCFAARSSKESLRDFLVDKYRTFTESLGGHVSVRGAYPAWEYKSNSNLRCLAIDKYKELTKKDLTVLSIHAGLECGIFTSKIKDLDVISIGPDILDIHTPMEKLSISSTARVYEYLLRLLRDAKDYL